MMIIPFQHICLLVYPANEFVLLFLPRITLEILIIDNFFLMREEEKQRKNKVHI